MEEGFERIAALVAMGIEAIVVLVIVIGTIEALYETLKQIAARHELRPALRTTWLRYAAWIVLALEFALAADLVGTIVSPSWDEIGKLAAIGAIRTALNFFLARDINEAREFAAKGNA